jgi:lipopolysaccharide transport system permease protein
VVATSDMHKTIIEPGRTETNYWRDLWRYRELFFFLAWRDILVRYKQTAIGIAWALLRPFLTMVVLTVVFGKIAALPSNGIPYPILVVAATLPWQFFSNSLAEASNSLAGNAHVISKIYFPRLILPAGAMITSLVDFFISLGLLAVLMAFFGFIPDWRLVALPVFTVLAFLAALGPSLFLTALNAKFRDVRYVIPFIVQFGLFISPVGFSSEVIPEKWRLLYSLNPMVGVIDGFRWAICRGTSGLYVPGFILSLAVVVLFLWFGLWYFRKTEKSFADII